MLRFLWVKDHKIPLSTYGLKKLDIHYYLINAAAKVLLI